MSKRKYQVELLLLSHVPQSLYDRALTQKILSELGIIPEGEPKRSKTSFFFMLEST